jgi:hypothetical protein
MNSRHQLIIAAVHSTVSVLPTAGMLALWSYAIRASLIIKKWPHYNLPDPGNLQLFYFHKFVGVAFLVSLLSIPMWFVITLLLNKGLSNSTIKRNVWIFASAVTFLTVQILLDPGGMLEWYVD